MNAVRETLVFSIPADHPACAGHFPGFPVVPGAVLLDEVLSRLESALAIDLCAYRLAAAKFPAPLHPGCAVALDYRREAGGAVHFSLAADGQVVAMGSLVPL